MRLLIYLLVPLFLLLTACSPSTKVISSWSDPATKLEPGHFKKMLCIVMVMDESNRRVAEDKLVSLMPQGAVQSYTWFNVLPDSVDKQRVGEALRSSGFDSVLIMRLVRREKDVTYVPGSYPTPYYSAWGYYGYAHPYYADPGYIRTDDYYYVETNLYDMAQDKLVWTGMTSSWEPSSVASAVEGIVNAVYQKMRDEGFVTTPVKQ